MRTILLAVLLGSVAGLCLFTGAFLAFYWKDQTGPALASGLVGIASFVFVLNLDKDKLLATSARLSAAVTVTLCIAAHFIFRESETVEKGQIYIVIFYAVMAAGFIKMIRTGFAPSGTKPAPKTVPNPPESGLGPGGQYAAAGGEPVLSPAPTAPLFASLGSGSSEDNELLEGLKSLIPSQFSEIVFTLGINTYLLQNGSLVEQMIEVIKLMKQQDGGLGRLREEIDRARRMEKSTS